MTILDKKGATHICAVAHQNISTQSRQKTEPVIGECDAGLAKICCPIFVNGTWLGVCGGCGLLLDKGEQIDTYLVHKRNWLNSCAPVFPRSWPATSHA